MKRFSAHVICASAGVELLRTVVELENGLVVGIISLDNTSVETAHTLFVDGMITPGLISIKENTVESSKVPDLTNFNYIDLSDGTGLPEVINTDLPLIFDFGTSNLPLVNKIIGKLADSGFSLPDLVNACIFHPSKVLGISSDIRVGHKTNLIHWRNVDLVNRKLTSLTRLEKL